MRVRVKRWGLPAPTTFLPARNATLLACSCNMFQPMPTNLTTRTHISSLNCFPCSTITFPLGAPHFSEVPHLFGTQISQVEGHSGKEVRVYAKDAHGERTVEGTDLFVSVGRTPNTQGIGLEEFGVKLDERGYIKVNDRLETTASNVWAMGDCAGSPQFTHVAYHDFRIVRDNLKGGNRTTKDRLAPFCMFTDPELARVGRNETEAKRDKIEYRVATPPMANVLRTHAIAEPRGFMKMLIGEESDEIIGFTAFGIEASELMAAVQTAMVGRLPYTVLRDAIFAHPTMSEGLVYLLGQVEKPKS
jgi:pyruvate/2-oxoglutarate dehydrogenase complex dihydrolipoamide dehydrogenase (E3) component